LYESITDYNQRLLLAQTLLAQQSATDKSTPEAKFAVAQDIASLVAPSWEWVIRKWTPKGNHKTTKPEVSGRQIAFNPNISLAELAAVIVHKTDHLVMGHQNRRGARDEKLWNLAASLEGIRRWKEVFDGLGLRLPESIDPSRTIQNLPRTEAEKLYEMLELEQPQEGDQQQQGESETEQTGESQPSQGDLEKAAAAGDTSSDTYDQSMLERNDGKGLQLQEDDQAKGTKPGVGSGSYEHKNDPRAPYMSLIQLIRRRLNLGNNRMNFTLRRPSSRSEQTNGGVLSRLDQAPDELRVVIDTSHSVDKPLLNAIFRSVNDLERATKAHNAGSQTVYAHGGFSLVKVGNSASMQTIVAGVAPPIWRP
jgi:predicted metal-dependent peptidase